MIFIENTQQAAKPAGCFRLPKSVALSLPERRAEEAKLRGCNSARPNAVALKKVEAASRRLSFRDKETKRVQIIEGGRRKRDLIHCIKTRQLLAHVDDDE
jgi:hypothetical protein